MNYDPISQTYDTVRDADGDLVSHLAQAVHLHTDSRVLDIGCGTGNYADQLCRRTSARIAGLDTSLGMLQKAQEKNSHLGWQQADAEHLPFAADTFDFIYMTDVIHHILHIDLMFSEVARVLKPDAKVCVVTQSYAQIDKRPTTRFFPATALVDKARYPDTPAIVAAALGCGLKAVRIESLNEGKPILLDSAYLKLVTAKGYSMLRFISESDFQAGLRDLQHQLARGAIETAQAGDTLIWLKK